MKSIRYIFGILFLTIQLSAQYTPIFSTPGRGITPPPNSGSQCSNNTNPPTCPTYDVTGMNWYLTAPNPARPITIQWSSLGNHDWGQTMPNGFFEWEDPDGLLCVNSPVINVTGLGSVQMNFAALKFGSDNSTSDGHVNFGYRVNGGAWVVSPNFSIAGSNTGGSWNQTASGNSIEIRACADFGGQNQDTRLTVFNTNLGSLPVKWAGLSGELTKEGNARILWQTHSEINNDYFQIERSMDGILFEAISQIKGSGNTNDLSTYEYIDKSILPGNIYQYRVKQVDYDGKFEYSTLVEVATKKQIEIRIQPNPVNNLLKIEINNPQNQAIELTINSMNGYKVRTIFMASEQYFIESDISDLPPGAYFISSNYSDIKHIRFIKTDR